MPQTSHIQSQKIKSLGQVQSCQSAGQAHRAEEKKEFTILGHPEDASYPTISPQIEIIIPIVQKGWGKGTAKLRELPLHTGPITLALAPLLETHQVNCSDKGLMG